MAKIYVMCGRKQSGPDIPDDWTETHWERFDYIECGIYEKSDADLNAEDQELVEAYGDAPDGWLAPMEKPAPA